MNGKKLKAGHAGTLDPIARGVLVVALGKATRLIPYVQQYPKTYVASFQLDVDSESNDTETELVKIEPPVRPDRQQVEAALPNFRGNLLQKPPAYSAISIGGKRAYRLARQGIDFEISEKRVVIHDLQILDYQYPVLNLKVVCGSGTYIRSLGRDLAIALGTHAVMTSLERTEIGPFKLSSAIQYDRLDGTSLESDLLAPDMAIQYLPKRQVTDEEIQVMSYGGFLKAGDVIPGVEQPDGADHLGPSPDSEAVAIDDQGQLVALLKSMGEEWKPSINFVGRS